MSKNPAFNALRWKSEFADGSRTTRVAKGMLDAGRKKLRSCCSFWQCLAQICSQSCCSVGAASTATWLLVWDPRGTRGVLTTTKPWLQAFLTWERNWSKSRNCSGKPSVLMKGQWTLSCWKCPCVCFYRLTT